MKKRLGLRSAILREIPGGVTAAKGFSASATKAGIKISGAQDCGLLLSNKPCSAAGAFTTNLVRASSVDWCENVLPDSNAKAVFVNSGNANACTGARGKKDTQTIAVKLGRMMGVPPQAVLVASTGVIGHYLPMPAIERSFPFFSVEQRHPSRVGHRLQMQFLQRIPKRRKSRSRWKLLPDVIPWGGAQKGRE